MNKILVVVVVVVVVVYINYMLPNPLPFLKAFHTYRYSTTTCTFHRTIHPKLFPLKLELLVKTFYCRIDRDRSGTICSDELQQALSNGNW